MQPVVLIERQERSLIIADPHFGVRQTSTGMV